MKHIIRYSILLTAYCLLGAGDMVQGAGSSYNEPGGDLKITVSNIYPAEGKLYVAIYDNVDDYMDIEKVAFQKIVPIKNETESFVIPGMPDGEYAVTVFQDLNDNGELDTSSIGFPREPYGFSNDARGTFGPPKFRKAKFSLNGDKDIRIKLVNDEKEDQ